MLSKRTLFPALLLLISSSVLAGERLTLEELVARCDAVAEVSVALATSENRDRITAICWLTAQPEDIQPAQEWIHGQCLPSRKILTERWITGLFNIPSLPLWRAALEKGEYRAVVFLKKENGKFRPTCEAESILVENWASHPNHAKWRARLLDLIERAGHLKRKEDNRP